MPTLIDMIKSILTIEEALERYTGVDLSKVNTRKEKFYIRCPFHNDNNPSFTVYTHTNTFRCWAGCNEGRSGNVINLVALSLNIDNRSAIHFLAQDLNIKKTTGVSTQLSLSKNASDYTINNQAKETLVALGKLALLLDKKILKIKTIDDLEWYGELYHPRVLIEYWMNCLKENNPALKNMVLADCRSFIERMIKFE